MSFPYPACPIEKFPNSGFIAARPFDLAAAHRQRGVRYLEKGEFANARDDFATLAPGVHVSGKVAIEHGAYLGTGAVTVDGAYDRPLRIGRHSVVSAGALVIRDVPPDTTVSGVPARELVRKRPI